jgi:glycosyltransferase involved in cell wall biosynthesis
MPYFSIIISTYNRSLFLEEAVNSVLNQTFSDYELIVVDDGSTDDTVIRISEISKYDSRVKYLYQKNSERAAARNNGIRNSSGVFLVFLDSDDLWLGDHLSTLYDSIQANQNIEVFSNKYIFFDENLKFYNADINNLKGIYGRDIVLNGNPFAVNFCIKKNSKLVYFPEDRSFASMEDWMFLVLNLYHRQIFVSDKVTMHMRDHKQRSMRSLASILAEKRLKACNALIETFKGENEVCQELLIGSYQFCAIHYYIDNKRADALNYWWLKIKAGGLSFFDFALLLKILIGKKMIAFFKKT